MAFAAKYKTLDASITKTEALLSKTKSKAKKAEYNKILAAAKKQMGQFDEMQKDAKTKLEKLQGAAKEALAAKEKDFDSVRGKLEGQYNEAVKA